MSMVWTWWIIFVSLLKWNPGICISSEEQQRDKNIVQTCLYLLPAGTFSCLSPCTEWQMRDYPAVNTHLSDKGCGTAEIHTDSFFSKAADDRILLSSPAPQYPPHPSIIGATGAGPRSFNQTHDLACALSTQRVVLSVLFVVVFCFNRSAGTHTSTWTIICLMCTISHRLIDKRVVLIQRPVLSHPVCVRPHSYAALVPFQVSPICTTTLGQVCLHVLLRR